MTNSRRKGHDFERYICKKLRDLFPKVERTQEGDSLDRAGVDIRGAGQFRVQAKRGRAYSSINKIQEVQVEGIPILWTKGDNLKPVVCMYEDDFINLLSEKANDGND